MKKCNNANPHIFRFWFIVFVVLILVTFISCAQTSQQTYSPLTDPKVQQEFKEELACIASIRAKFCPEDYCALTDEQIEIINDVCDLPQKAKALYESKYGKY